MSESIYPQNSEVEKLPKLVNEYEIPTFEENTEDYWKDYPYGSTKIQLRPGIEVAQDSESVWALFTSGTGSITTATQTTPTWSGWSASDSSMLWTNQFTIPSDWTYLATATVRWNWASTGIRKAILLLGWSFVTAWVQLNQSGTEDEYCHISTVFAATRGQAVKCDVYQNSWGTISLNWTWTRFSIHKIS